MNIFSSYEQPPLTPLAMWLLNVYMAGGKHKPKLSRHGVMMTHFCKKEEQMILLLSFDWFIVFGSFLSLMSHHGSTTPGGSN